MTPITCQRDVDRGLGALLEIDPRLEPLAAIAGRLPLRLSEPGFASLARIVSAQLVSQASADAIHARFTRLVPGQTARAWLAAPGTDLEKIGLTRTKRRTLQEVANAIVAGRLDLAGLADLDERAAVAELERFHGIGRWTAEVYLLSCCGHRDIFPAGDLALRRAVGIGLNLGETPDEVATRDVARNWKPVRGIAARLFWAYYANQKGERTALRD